MTGTRKHLTADNPSERTHALRPCLLIGGWGQSAASLAPLKKALEPSFELSVRLLDQPLADLKDWLKNYQKEYPDALWIGWSLGGQLAIQQLDEQVRACAGLVLLASNPCFVARQGWPGMPEAEYLAFCDLIKKDPVRGLQRFQALQSRGAVHAREELVFLRRSVTVEMPPAHLSASLTWLFRLDGRALMERLRVPVLVLNGDRDSLVPLSWTDQAPQHWQIRVIEGMAHYPGPSSVAELSGLIMAFSQRCAEHQDGREVRHAH